MIAALASHGCKKPAAESGGAAGSATAGSATASGSAATSPQAAALDELDRWLAPLAKLDVRAQLTFMCEAMPVLRDKTTALYAGASPAGVAADNWRSTGEALSGSVESVGMCCQSYGFYDKPPKPHGDEDDWRDCMKAYPDAFAAVAKLVPGGKPLGVHANDPVMTPPNK